MLAEIRIAWQKHITEQGLQWGREQLLAEIGFHRRNRRQSAGFNGAASSCSRKCADHHGHGGSVPASMGPRAVARGNGSNSSSPSGIRIASMGPRAVARGNVGSAAPTTALLPLQWGREQLLAEIPEQMCARRELSASMGPRAVARGNGAMTAGSQTLTSLQWGREQLLAEMRKRGRTDNEQKGFNGAASSCSRKCPGGHSSRLPAGSFNGAASSCSRKFPSPPTGPSR